MYFLYIFSPIGPFSGIKNSISGKSAFINFFFWRNSPTLPMPPGDNPIAVNKYYYYYYYYLCATRRLRDGGIDKERKDEQRENRISCACLL